MPFTPLNDLRRQLVYSHNGSAVVMTMVAGKVVMRDGCVFGVDAQPAGPADQTSARVHSGRSRLTRLNAEVLAPPFTLLAGTVIVLPLFL